MLTVHGLLIQTLKHLALAFFPDLGEVSASRTNSVPLVRRKLLRQAGQSLTDLVILTIFDLLPLDFSEIDF